MLTWHESKYHAQTSPQYSEDALVIFLNMELTSLDDLG